MDFQPVYDIVKTNGLGVIGTARTQAEARLLPQNGGSIAKVLSVSASPRVRVSEVFTGEARIAGRVELCVLYLCGEGKNRVMRQSVELTDKLASPEITDGSRLFVTAVHAFVEVTAVSADEIRLSATVETTLGGDREKEIKYLSDAEGALVNKTDTDYNALVCICEDRCALSASLPKEGLGAVLTGEHKIMIESAIALPGAIKLSGSVISDVCGEGEDGLLSCYRSETPFTREIEATEAKLGDIIEAFACVGGVITSDDEGGTVEYDVEFAAFVYRPSRFSAASDAFSPECELSVTAQSVSIETDKAPVVVNERVDGSITLGDGLPSADNILASSAFHLELANVAASDGELLLEGIVVGNVIYYGAEAESEGSVSVELPFSLRTTADELNAADELVADGEVTSVTVKLRRGNEIDIRAHISVTVRARSVTNTGVITELSAGEERAKSDHAFTVHIAAEGESVWDVAKELGCDPAEIAAQNPALGERLSGGERVIIYRSYVDSTENL